MTTKTKNDCRTKGLCRYESLTRTKFFHGMLLTDEHLRAEQTYHRESLKRLNQHLWGSGIACGLEVTAAGGLCIKIHPGLALDCEGNVIEVCKSITIDLAELCKKAYPDGCTPEDAPKITRHLVLRYAEVPADPEPVLTASEDCGPAEGTKCEASKYREGFCIEFRDTCPNCGVCEEAMEEDEDGLVTTVVKLSRQAGIRSKLEDLRPGCMESPPCPKCECDDGAVGIATLEVDCADHTVEINCDCRDYVWSPRLMRWLLCRMLGGIDRLTPDETNFEERFPSADAMIARPLRGAWDATVVLAGGEGARRLRQDVANLTARVSALEKGPKTKQPKE